MTKDEYKVSLGSEENILKLDYSDALCEYTKTH